MTPAPHTQLDLARHYAVIRSRLWPREPMRRPEPTLRAWTTPTLTEVLPTDERIPAILAAMANERRPTAQAAIRETAKAYGVDAQDIVGPGRNGRLIEPRHVAMAIAAHVLKGKTRGTFGKIGMEFGRDHTTVLYGVHKYRDAVKAAAERMGAAGALQLRC